MDKGTQSALSPWHLLALEHAEDDAAQHNHGPDDEPGRERLVEEEECSGRAEDELGRNRQGYHLRFDVAQHVDGKGVAPDCGEEHEAEEAEVHLHRALALDPRNHDARITLGRLQLAQERDDDAVATFRTARRLYPFDPDVNFNLGLACLRVEETTTAIRALEATLRIAPNDREAAALLETARRMDSMMPGPRIPVRNSQRP